MTYLLDVNVLVALSFASHPDHQRAHRWFRREPNRKWATCPLTQGGFLRVAGRIITGPANSAIPRALEALARDCQTAEHEYWELKVDLRDAPLSLQLRLNGPNQITDLQLLLLAHQRRGRLATLDGGIRALAEGTPHAESLVVIADALH